MALQKINEGISGQQAAGIIYQNDLENSKNTESNKQDIARISASVPATRNLADKAKILYNLAVMYSSGNITNPGVAGRQTLIVPIPKRNTVYSIVGLQGTTYVGRKYNNTVNPDDYTSFNTSNSTGVLSDNIGAKTSASFNSGEDTYFVALLITQSDAPAGDTVMLYEGPLSANPPYEPYGSYLDASKLIGAIPNTVTPAQLSAQLAPVVSEVNILKGRTSVIEDKTDIIEITHSSNLADKSKIIDHKAPSYSSGAIVDIATGYMLIMRLPDKNTVYSIRGIICNSLHVYDGSVDPSDLSSFTGARRLQRLGDGVTTFTEFELNSGDGAYLVGRISYTDTPTTRDTVMLYEGTLSENPPYEPYGVDKSIDYSHIKNAPEAGTPNCFYTYNPTGGQTSTGRFTVYVKMRGIYYAGFNLDHVVNTAIRADLWRIRDTYTYRYNGSGMEIVAGNQLLNNQESEYVYAIQGASDSTGGFHGDEVYDTILFFADGLPVNISAAIPLTPCGVFKYQQISKTFNPDDTATPPVNVADHVKITTFSNGGFETFNRLIFKIPVTCVSIYGGLLTAYLPLAAYFYSKTGAVIQAVQGGAEPIKENGALDDEGEINYFNPATGLSAKFTSKFLKVTKAGLDVTRAVSDASLIIVWDVPQYAKGYHRNVQVNTFAVGDTIHSHQRVIFDKK